jgi:hypothetical protein
MPAPRRGARRQTWLDILASLEAGKLFLGGKSRDGRTQEENWREAIDAIVGFVSASRRQ